MQSPLPADTEQNANSGAGGKNAGGFDPYFKWLGIPPEEQPPNHYRLLGIPLFTHDADVIENAADQRMAHLRTQTAGQRQAEAQQLLNQVAMAKVSLLTVDKRTAYDLKLKASLKPKAQPAVAKPAGQPTAESALGRASIPASITPVVAEVLPTFGFSQPTASTANSARATVIKKERGKKKSDTPYQVYIKPLLIVGSSLLAAIIVVNLVLPPREDDPQDKPRTEKPADKKEVAVKPATPPETAVTKPPETTPLPKFEATKPGTEDPKKPSNPGQTDPPVKPIPKADPAETIPKVTPPPVDKTKQLQEAKATALKNKDLTGVLSAIEKLADEQKENPLEAQLNFLASETEVLQFDQNAVLIQLLDKMELAHRAGKKELALKFSDRCISLARELKDPMLINRATRLVIQLGS